MNILGEGEPRGVEVVRAIQQGDLAALNHWLDAQPAAATTRISRKRPAADIETRTLLHVATDWPGHFPNGARTLTILLAAGADVNARVTGMAHSETALHWAASCNDLPALEALIDGGADLESGGGVIGGGTPMADAVAFGQWEAARWLLQRGAKTNLWQAAALGLMERVQSHFGEVSPPAEECTKAFWCACHGGQRLTAEFLRERGADLNWIGYDNKTPIDAARESPNPELAEWLATCPSKKAAEN